MSGRAVTPRHGRQMLVAVEVALAFVLLIGATLLIQSFVMLTNRVEGGYQSTNVLTAQLPTAPARFASGAALNAYLDDIASRIQALPRILDVAFTDALPTEGTPYGKRFQIVGHPTLPVLSRPSAGLKVVSPSYFQAVGLHVVAGRGLDDGDREGRPFVVVINETFARTYFSGVGAVGQHLLMARVPVQSGVTASGPGRPVTAPGDITWTIVGVIGDEGVSPFDNRVAEPALYATREQHPRSNLALVVRTGEDPTRLQEAIRRTVATFDRDQALADVTTLDQLQTDDLAPERLRSLLLGLFAAVALALAAIGVYGVIAYSVVQRGREMGIRAALGASARNLLTLVMRQGMGAVIVGLGAGLALALLLTRLLDTFLYGVGPWESPNDGVGHGRIGPRRRARLLYPGASCRPRRSDRGDPRGLKSGRRMNACGNGRDVVDTSTSVCRAVT